jgi:hypothetical protein
MKSVPAEVKSLLFGPRMYNRPSYRRSTKQRNSFESTNPVSCALPCLLCKKKKEFIVPWAAGPEGRIGANRKMRQGLQSATGSSSSSSRSLLPVRDFEVDGVDRGCSVLALWSAVVGIPWTSASGIWESGGELHRWRALGLWECRPAAGPVCSCKGNLNYKLESQSNVSLTKFIW